MRSISNVSHRNLSLACVQGLIPEAVKLSIALTLGFPSL